MPGEPETSGRTATSANSKTRGVSLSRQLVTLVAISGGPFFLSDDLPNLPYDRRRLITNEEILKLAATAPASPAWEPEADGQPPSVWRRDDGLVAVFNWTSREREVALELNGARKARDLWENRDLEGLEDPWRIKLPPAGVRLIQLDSA